MYLSGGATESRCAATASKVAVELSEFKRIFEAGLGRCDDTFALSFDPVLLHKHKSRATEMWLLMLVCEDVSGVQQQLQCAWHRVSRIDFVVEMGTPVPVKELVPLIRLLFRQVFVGKSVDTNTGLHFARQMLRFEAPDEQKASCKSCNWPATAQWLTWTNKLAQSKAASEANGQKDETSWKQHQRVAGASVLDPFKPAVAGEEVVEEHRVEHLQHCCCNNSSQSAESGEEEEAILIGAAAQAAQ